MNATFSERVESDPCPFETANHALRSSAWHTWEARKLLEGLDSSPQGLSASEAAHRLSEFGPNLLHEAKPVRAWTIFIRQFQSLLVWMLIAAGIISGLLSDWVDCLAILAIVLLNAVIGFYQEFSAEKSIAALRRMTAPRATVRRDGKVVSVAAAQVVPGDILELEAGDLVPADARLLQATSLKCVESALTGESEAVDKRAVTLEEDDIPLGDRENMVFMGTHVAGGAGRGVVVATGMRTEIGRIAGLIEEAAADEGTPLQQKLQAFGRVLVWASLGIVVLLFVLGLIRGMKPLDLFMTSVSLAVAAVPEGLPAVVTIALALGVLRMARRRALVRKLPAVETLGSTNVICSDKTGTLTMGEMTVRELYVAGDSFQVTGEGYGAEGEVLFGEQSLSASQAAHLLELATGLIGCNNAQLSLEEGRWKVFGDPTEGALLAAGHKAGGSRERLERELPKHHEIPFDSDRKRRTVIRLLPDGRMRAFVNGAPEILLERCSHIHVKEGVRRMTEHDRERIQRKNAEMAGRGLRVLGSTYRDLEDYSAKSLEAEQVERDLTFVGLAGMYDPPRPEAKQAVSRCREAGIRVVMITGDHPHTALAIARELGIAARDTIALSGVELDKLSDDQLRERVTKIAVYARVTAQHKLRIVRAWKASGAVVAMTGDGVNDAPAIKGADIGIAMGRTGTEVTRQASDMIITDDNFASIVAAVEEGRGIYANIRKTLKYLLASNAGELILMTGAIMLGLPAPLLPIHLLWINLVTDGPPALCLASDPIDPDAMGRKPRSANEKMTSGSFLPTIGLIGLLSAMLALAAFLYGLKFGTLSTARAYAFAALVFAQLLLPFGFHSDRRPVWRFPLRSNFKLAAVVGCSIALQVFIHHNELLSKWLKTSLLTTTDCLVLLILSLIPLGVLELIKCRRRRL